MKFNIGPGPPDDYSPSDPHETLLTNCRPTLHCRDLCSPCQGSLTNSTGSERGGESDSACVCGSPSENLHHETFDWWFLRNRSSNKSR